MSLARRATVEITWTAKDNGPNGLLQFGGQPRDITKDISPYLLGLTYVDNLTGAVDDLSIDLHDREGLWSGDWRPAFGDTVEAWINADPWLTTVKRLRLGKFSHDKLSIAGGTSGKTARIQAVSAALDSGLRRTKRTRAWKGVTLYQIAADIADRAHRNLDWLGSDGLTYKCREQKDKTDLVFLEELCKDVGRDVKFTEDAITIFPELDRDTAPSIGTVNLIGGYVQSYAFDDADAARYGSCHLKFLDPRSGKEGDYQFPPTTTTRDAWIAMGLDPDGQTLEIRLAVDDAAHAVEICQGRLRVANRFAAKGTIVVIGDPGLVAGVVFDLDNAFGFEGRYIVTKATHRPVDGYLCTLEIRRTVEGF